MKTKNCSRCGGMLIAGPYGSNQWECHNDQCDLNREGLARLEVFDSVRVALRFVNAALRFVAVGLLLAGASYGAYLLIWR